MSCRSQQMPLGANVRFEVSVRKHGRELYHTATSGADQFKRGAQLEMARIVAAQIPGSRVSFRRVPVSA